MEDAFDEDELRELCFDLGIDYDNLLGGKAQKIRGIITYMERRGITYKLVDYCQQNRPPAEQWSGFG